MQLEPEYYMGWVMQPLNIFGTVFYVYDKEDTTHPRGIVIRGSWFDCFDYIDRKVGRKKE